MAADLVPRRRGDSVVPCAIGRLEGRCGSDDVGRFDWTDACFVRSTEVVVLWYA